LAGSSSGGSWYWSKPIGPPSLDSSYEFAADHLALR
jgi:hypothetical protein